MRINPLCRALLAVACLCLASCQAMESLTRLSSRDYHQAPSEAAFLATFSNTPAYEMPAGWPEDSLYRLLKNPRSEVPEAGPGSTVRLSGVPERRRFLAELRDAHGEPIESALVNLRYDDGHLLGPGRFNFKFWLIFNAVSHDQMVFGINEDGNLVSMRHTSAKLLLVAFPVMGGGGGPAESAVYERR